MLLDGSLSGGVNQMGIDHYNSLIDELIKYGNQLEAHHTHIYIKKINLI